MRLGDGALMVAEDRHRAVRAVVREHLKKEDRYSSEHNLES